MKEEEKFWGLGGPIFFIFSFVQGGGPKNFKKQFKFNFIFFESQKLNLGGWSKMKIGGVPNHI